MIFRPDIILIDGSSYIYRAFHALPPLTTSTGRPTGATRGFASMLRKLISTYPNVPMVMVFDAKGKTFRSDYYKGYKANRPSMPNELRSQISDIKELTKLFKLHSEEVVGVEADDVIATLAKSFGVKHKVLISSPDKDLTQLVTDKVIQHNSMSDDFFDEAKVFEKFGVMPNQIKELLALVGDKADNIPGITKVGPKTAAKWLNEFGSINALIDSIDQIKGVVGEHLRNEQEFIKRNLFLVSLKEDLDLKLSIQDISLPQANNSELVDFYRSLEFNTFIESATPAVQSLAYKTISNTNELEELNKELEDAEYFSFDTETSSLNLNEKNIVGLSFSTKKGTGSYVPINHTETTNLSEAEIMSWLKQFLENNQRKMIGHNLKFDLAILENYDISLDCFLADTILMSYVFNSTASRHNLDALAEHYLSRKTIKFEDVIGKGKSKLKNFSEVPIKEATNYAAEDAEVTLCLYQTLLDKLTNENKQLLERIENQLVFVLMQMEKTGALIDQAHLNKLSNEFGSKLIKLVKSIHDKCQVVFNLDSPKQLSEVLFDKLGMPTKGLKKTASGYFSTSESILQQLAEENQVVENILEYRSLAKLKSTYTDKISEICDHNSRVHTSYHQAVTSTGRLSSSEPNLQNIPIRTKEGITIREAFVAPPDKKILALDYSQIELRLMAHYSQDKTMVNSFNNDEDIHKRTAAEIFGVPLDQITADMRRRAKTINFGLLYGMSAFGLANQLKVSRPEAEMFLTSYFEKYSSVKSFMENIVEQAKASKYVETLYGRKIHVPNIDSPNYMMRQASERVAINGPLQGSAADIIKVAMIEISKLIKKQNLKIDLIMQVHDELVFEVPAHFNDSSIKEIIQLMEESTKISVPLRVDYGFGANWKEAH
ncbi:MAG: DNA polymerase I [Proteobacteria bacterium]|nr:DNA polymerase I [SAR86 cluster bacterium]MDA0344370.1 DNA polymerase I [Pseudomonadota bacterium]MDA0899614.1 DNA polymerase I [Pseudomonadota bacterium]